jgi:hypothetical protein
MKPNTIQFWSMVGTLGLVICSLAGGMIGFAAWADARYAKETKVESLSWEVHALYLTIPDDKRNQIEKEREKFEMEQDQK